jgi:hypothetical protein
MKELEQKADEMLRQNGHYADFYRVEKADIHLAIQSVNHTIEVLEGSNIQADNQERLINSLINEQIELKKILESRL